MFLNQIMQSFVCFYEPELVLYQRNQSLALGSSHQGRYMLLISRLITICS